LSYPRRMPANGTRTRNHLFLYERRNPDLRNRPTSEETANKWTGASPGGAGGAGGAGGESRTLDGLLTRQVLGHPSNTGVRRSTWSRTRMARRMRPARSPSLPAAIRTRKVRGGERGVSNPLPPGPQPGVSTASTSITARADERDASPSRPGPGGQIRTDDRLCVKELRFRCATPGCHCLRAMGVGPPGIEPGRPAVSGRCRPNWLGTCVRGPGWCRTTDLPIFTRALCPPELQDRILRWKGWPVPPRLLVGGSHACISQHLSPEMAAREGIEPPTTPGNNRPLYR
jgi:hypothetical protein